MNSFNRVIEMRNLINVEENMYCLDGDVIEIDGIKFGGCDSWYSNSYLKAYYPLRNFNQRSINNQWRNSMNQDYKFIKGIENYDDIYKIEIEKIKSVYQDCDVMITHVNPSIRNENMGKRFKPNQSNTFFSFYGHEFMNSGTMKYWVFGHTHEKIEYEYSGVKCICNPMGYPSKNNQNDEVKIKSIKIQK